MSDTAGGNISDECIIRDELGRILASPVFANSPRMSRFLAFVVEEALSGNGGRIKEYVIALEVFDKPQDYDPHVDSTVRTEASKLRARLNRYYETQGRADPIVISIPKGSYLPVFESGQSGAGAAPVWRRRWVWTAAGLLALAGAGALRLAWRQSATQPVYPDPVPLTSYPGRELQPSFSPDGNEVAFAWDGERRDNFDIYIKQVGADKALRLTTDPARDFGPAWSPDGRWIAFGRLLSPVRSGIFLIPALGGPERKVGETRAPSVAWPQPFLAWSPDGKWLAVSDTAAPGLVFAPSGFTPAGLFLLSVETGEKRRLTSDPAHSVVDAGPAFSPDGHTLAFARSPALAVSDLYLLPLSPGLAPAGEPRRLTFRNQFATGPAWTRDGKELVFAMGQWETRRLWRVAVSGTPAPRRLEFAGERSDQPAISHQGRLAYSQTTVDVNIWRADLAAPGKAGLPRPFIASTRTEVNPQFSPDGRHIVFPSDRGGSLEIWVCDRDGSNAMQVTSMEANITGSPRWSPDGTRIVFDSNREGQFEVYTVSATGGTLQRLTNHPAADCCASWSHDGHWIYFMSNRTGQRQIWKMPAVGGEALQVTRHGGVVAFESPDGRFLYYSERAGEGERNGMSGLRKVPVEGGDETPVLPSVTFLNFTIAREGIYYIPRADPEGRYSIEFFDFATGASRPVLALSGGVAVGMSVSPDGRALLYSQDDEVRSDLMLVENFR